MFVEDFLSFTVFQVVVGIYLVFIPLLPLIYNALRKFRYRFFEALQHLPTPLQFVLKHAAVVGIGRSGGIVATILAGCLRSCPVLVVDVDIDKTTKSRRLRPESEKALESIDRKGKLLIVMADVITGDSIQKVCEKLHNSIERKIAALYRSPSAFVVVDFSVLNGPTPPEWPFRLVSSFGYRFYTWEGRETRL